MTENFQDGCNSIVDKLKELGVTPLSNSPEDIISAISKLNPEVKTITKSGSWSNNNPVPWDVPGTIRIVFNEFNTLLSVVSLSVSGYNTSESDYGGVPGIITRGNIFSINGNTLTINVHSYGNRWTGVINVSAKCYGY